MEFSVNPLSVKNNSVDEQTASVSHGGHNNSAHVAHSSRLQTDAGVVTESGFRSTSSEVKVFLIHC